MSDFTLKSFQVNKGLVTLPKRMTFCISSEGDWGGVTQETGNIGQSLVSTEGPQLYLSGSDDH